MEMPHNSTPNERKRLEALKLYDILDTVPEQQFDDIALLASEICQTPIALISLVDENRQWFKSKIGLDVSETNRDISFCTHAINSTNIFEVSDPSVNPVFANNPLVTGHPNIRYYAGSPLIASDGSALGTLCVIHTQSHELTESQKRSLAILSRSVMTLLEMRYRQKQTDFFKKAMDEIAAVAVFDKETNFEYANSKYCELAGVPENEIVGRHYDTVALADITKDAGQHIINAISKGETYRDTIKNINKKGDVSWSNLTVIPYMNNKQEMVKLFTIRVDATPLIQLIDRFHKAEDLADIGCWELNLLNGKRFWSNGMYSLMNFDLNNLPRNTPTLIDYIIPEQRYIVEASLNQFLKGNIDTGIDEIDVVTANGSHKTMAITRDLTYNKNGEPILVSGTIQDITERKQTEKRLKDTFDEVKQLSDSREVLSLTADNLSAMLAYWDKDLICRFANNAYLHWFGKSREEMTNKMSIVELLGPLYEKNKPYIDAVLDGNAQTFEREIPLPDGTGGRYSLANYFPHTVDGVVKGFFVHVADITPQKKLEIEIRETSDKIHEQNKRLLNFANIVTHNLKSYANNLGLILEMYIAADNEVEKDQMLGFLKDISDGFTNTIVHLTEVVDTQNKSEVTKAPLVLHDYIKKAIDALRIDISNTKAVVKNNVDPSLTLLGNPAYFDSIFLNFLSNAIKYKHHDRHPLVEINAENTGEELIITIKDNGRGIDLKKNGEKLFGMYQTFHGNADAKGVGLYLVRSQVEAMNGKIEAESEENIGTTFTLRFKI